MSESNTIEIENLGKCYQIYQQPKDRLKQSIFRGKKQFYQEFWALKNISFSVKPGEAVGVIGRNGSGKSTLLQLICGTLAQTTGVIAVKGRIAALLELGAGFNPEFTGRENVYLNGAILGFTKKQMAQRFTQIEQFADIGDFIDRPVKTYSSGMFVRLAFAVQVCVEPEILIVDEALAVGDVFFRQKCYQRLQALLEKGTTILLVSHAMGEVEQFCQKALLLDKGRQIFWGKANEAVRHYYLVEQQQQQQAFQTGSETITAAEICKQHLSPDDLFTWPDDSAFINIAEIPQINNSWGRCLRVTICDKDRNPCFVFEQGKTASFYFEFELLHDIEVPMVGVVIKNENGIIVHGKGSIEHGAQVPHYILKGDRLQIKQEIELSIAIGEYTYEIGLATLKSEDYLRRSELEYEVLYQKSIRICHLANVGSFVVTPRTIRNPVQLLHHGIANLPGSCNMRRLSEKVNE